jgi:hypothetical protein
MSEFEFMDAIKYESVPLGAPDLPPGSARRIKRNSNPLSA